MAQVERYFAVALALLLAALSPTATSNEPEDGLTVLSWGGAYERAQQLALFAPFSEATGKVVRVERYNGGLDGLRHAIESGEVPWDVIDMTRSDALAACDEGLLQPLSPTLVDSAPDGTPPEQDFIDGAFDRCSITHTVFATVVAYRRDAFPGKRPTSIGDLFDQQRFPGPRALQRTPEVNLEWALLSYRVPREELYGLLSTQRGLRLALKRLDSLDNIHWWEAGDVPPRLLAEGEVVMASGYNGRFFDAIVNRNLPIEILWDGQVQEHETWVVPQGAPHPELARNFIRFATTTERLAALASRIPYGPARHSAAMQVTTHPDNGMDMRLHIPTHPLNAERAVTKDDDWYARTYQRIRERFDEWLSP
ncbi:spermidine/putrescine ABC transporter substrate-binding protein [Litchfieldella qijiaojingensis]|uniref:Spermidine/putrescine ABC transporter substrate-binding protein n=1 Tax=Litchfieldella qijiaojingensis TaxID=980347 RepID=A0ABQ2YBT2_9GAMM|nr:extracellular solute-binding protein [Halomonas qijiaojingensis]GGX77281.1 spermidine/putrescine ABC transporter substrate-binding protein [Halomonas qijiaojingensis]